MAASDEQFSLCWNNFHANMSAGFHGLLSRGDLVDVTLAAEGRLLQAHKLVLSVCSPFFQEMFKMNPTQHPIVFLKDVSHAALRDLLQFMYQGEVNVKQEELASFISTAEQLQVKGLTGNQNEENSTPKPKPASRPGPRSSQQRMMASKLETDSIDTKPASTPVAIKRPNRPSIASNNSSSSQTGPAKRKCIDPLEAGPSGSNAKEEFVTIPDEDDNAMAPKMEPEFVNDGGWDDDDDGGANNDDTAFGEDDSTMEMTGFDGSGTGDASLTGATGEGGAVGDAQDAGVIRSPSELKSISEKVGEVHFIQTKAGHLQLIHDNYIFVADSVRSGRTFWRCMEYSKRCRARITSKNNILRLTNTTHNHSHNHSRKINSKYNEYFAVVVDYQDDLSNDEETFQSDNVTIEEPGCNDSGVNKPLEFILSIRGNPQLVYQGQTYNFEKMCNFKKMWQCTQAQRFKCRARLATVGSKVYVTRGIHSHSKIIDSLTYIRTRRGAPSLVLNGYAYHARRQRGTRVYWACRVRVCKARAVTRNGRLMQATGTHPHMPNTRLLDTHERIESLIEMIPADVENSEEVSSLKYIRTRRGAPSLVLEGHAYHAVRQRGTRVYWACRVRVCKARAVTRNGQLMQCTGTHPHMPNTRLLDTHERIESLIETVPVEVEVVLKTEE